MAEHIKLDIEQVVNKALTFRLCLQLGESILSDSSKVKSIVRSFQKFREGDKITEEANANGEEATENIPTVNGTEATEGETTEGETNEGETNEGETNEDDVDPEILNMLKNLSKENKDKPLPENIFENGLIGKLAQELSDEINLEDMNLGVDENTNVGGHNLSSGGAFFKKFDFDFIFAINCN